MTASVEDVGHNTSPNSKDGRPAHRTINVEEQAEKEIINEREISLS